MATPLGIFRGSSLNLEWSKRGIRLDDQWMLISWLHIEDFVVFFCASLPWLLGTLTCWLYWLIISYCLAHWFWFCHDYFDHFTWPRYITQLAVLFHWLAYYLDRLLSMIFISLFILIVVALYVDMSDISCTLLDCMMHDCPPSAWLHVVCLCGSHFYPLTSHSLGVGHSFHLGSHYCKCETFCVLALWPSQRLGVGSSDGLYRCTGTFWRWPTRWCREESDHWRPV